MDDFWNDSGTAPSTLDNFFDEECDINWTGSSTKDPPPSNVSSSFGEVHSSPSAQSLSQEVPKPQHRSSLSSGSLSSILDNISIHSDSGITGIGSNRAKVVGKALGEKIDSWKAPSVSIKWKNEGSGSCLQCSTKDEEILQLKRRLERAYSRHNITLPPGDTVQKVLLGLPYSLESYRVMEDKVSLLDCALDTMDSSTILAVVIFMRNSTRRSVFLKELQTRPLAAQVYINYLKHRLENTEVLEILGMLGRAEEAAMFKYELALGSSTPEAQVKNLKNALQTHFMDPALYFESKVVNQHWNLIELQAPIEAKDSKDHTNPLFVEHPRATSILGQPLLTTLFYCSMYHWQATEDLPQSPLFLRKKYKISDKQFLWTVLRARAKVKHWPLPSDLENLLATRGLMGTLSAFSRMSGGGNVVRNALPIERVIDTLASTGAPPNVLSAFISLLTSNEAKLKMGLAYNCHQAVVEAYVGLQDRESLEKYLTTITFGSPEYIKAEQALKNTKWRE